MTNQETWAQSGFGNTGESYLVGPDQFMRSVSRRSIEDPIGYIEALRENDLSPQTIDNIQKHDTYSGSDR